MEVAAGDDRTRIVLERRIPKGACKHCRREGHNHLSCPFRPCYLCRREGHLQSHCPFRTAPGAHEAALRRVLAARRPGARPFSFLRAAELDAASPYDLVFRDAQFDAKVSARLTRVHERRVTALEFHPSGRYILTGDKRGVMAIWDLGTSVFRGDIGLNHTIANAAHCNINAMSFDGHEVVYLSSSDGTVRRHPLDATSSGDTQNSRAQMRIQSGETVLDLNPDGWNGPRTWRMVYGMDFDARGHRALYAGDCKGVLHVLDARASDPVANSLKLHKDKIQTVHVNPLRTELLVTASNDKNVRIWDARMLYPQGEIGAYSHDLCVFSAYFSPNSGAKLLTTCHDNRLRIWSDVHAFVGNVNARSDGSPKEIVHSCHFNRYLTNFKAVWDPKDWRDDLFLCGRNLGDAYYIDTDSGDRKEAILHPIDLFSARNACAVNSLVDISVQTVCPANKFSPIDNLIASGTSLNVVVWAAPRFSEENKSSQEKREQRVNKDWESDDSKDVDPSKNAKRRKLAVQKVSKRSGTRTSRRRNTTLNNKDC